MNALALAALGTASTWNGGSPFWTEVWCHRSRFLAFSLLCGREKPELGFLGFINLPFFDIISWLQATSFFPWLCFWKCKSNKNMVVCTENKWWALFLKALVSWSSMGPTSSSILLLLYNLYVLKILISMPQTARINSFPQILGLQHHFGVELGDHPHHGVTGVHEDPQRAGRHRCEQQTPHNHLLSSLLSLKGLTH